MSTQSVMRVGQTIQEKRRNVKDLQNEHDTLKENNDKLVTLLRKIIPRNA